MMAINGDLRWTDDEIAYLRANIGQRSNAWLARKLGRTPQAIRGKAHELRLKRNTYQLVQQPDPVIVMDDGEIVTPSEALQRARESRGVTATMLSHAIGQSAWMSRAYETSRRNAPIGQYIRAMQALRYRVRLEAIDGN